MRRKFDVYSGGRSDWDRTRASWTDRGRRRPLDLAAT